tara:strand:- start:26802 stop:27713 length:912 start_codon:yes stop_codon:yes gene_type:complete
VNHNSSQSTGLKAKFIEAVLGRDTSGASQVIDSALELGLSAGDIYINILSESQLQIGQMYHDGEVTTALEHYATETALTQMIKVSNSFSPDKTNGLKAVVACVQGNMHSFGARIIADFLRLDGWKVEFLGSDTLTSDLIHFISSGGIDLVAISVSLQEQLPYVESIVDALQILPNSPKLILGGLCELTDVIENAKTSPESIRIIDSPNPLEAIVGARILCNIQEPNQKADSLEDYLTIIGNQIQSLRKGKSWSQSALASSSGLDRTYISAVEHGKQNLTIGAAVKLADALETSLIDLLTPSTK